MENDDAEDLEAIEELKEWRKELLKEIMESRFDALDWPCYEPNEVRDKIKQLKELNQAITERLKKHDIEWKENKSYKKSSVSPRFLADVWALKRKTK